MLCLVGAGDAAGSAGVSAAVLRQPQPTAGVQTTPVILQPEVQFSRGYNS